MRGEKFLQRRVFSTHSYWKLYDNSDDRSKNEKNECATCWISLEQVIIGGGKMSCRKKIDSKLWLEYSQAVRILCISIVFVHRDNGYPYPPNRGLTNRVSKVTELINRWDVITALELARFFHSCIPVSFFFPFLPFPLSASRNQTIYLRNEPSHMPLFNNLFNFILYTRKRRNFLFQLDWIGKKRGKN